MDINVITPGKKASSKVSVSDQVFSCEYNEPLIHQVVTAYLSGARAGTHAQKTRAEVSGGGAKPWKQKGTGRARAGTTRGPLWRHGGVTFAAKPTDYSQKVNKKMYRGAMRSIASRLVKDNRLLVLEQLTIKEPKTKELIALLKELKLQRNTLIVVNDLNVNLLLASRNIPHLTIIHYNEINPACLVANENILITKDALAKFNEAYA